MLASGTWHMPLWDVVQKSAQVCQHHQEEAGQISSLSCPETRPRNGGGIIVFNIKISPFSRTKNSSLIARVSFSNDYHLKWNLTHPFIILNRGIFLVCLNPEDQTRSLSTNTTKTQCLLCHPWTELLRLLCGWGSSSWDRTDWREASTRRTSEQSWEWPVWTWPPYMAHIVLT